MSPGILKPQLVMLRPDLEGLPAMALPDGYGVRHFRAGDGPAWTRIIAESFQGEEENYPFDRIMRSDLAFRPERIWFVTQGDEPVATTSAFYQPCFMPGAGMIHYVGVRGGHKGKKLGFWVTLAALHHMVVEGRSAAWLSTDDFRLPAIKTYLNLGFQPLLVHENQRERWRSVFTEMSLPQEMERCKVILRSALYARLAYPRDDFAYAGLVHERRRHHPSRPVGRPSLAEVDCFADESLYKGSALGHAHVEPDRVSAGQDQSFTLTLHVGPAGFAAGTRVLYHVSGQMPLGTKAQTEDASQPGHVSVDAPSHARIEAQDLGFVVKAGALTAGDVVRLHVGKTSGFTWTPLAGRKEFKVLVMEPGEPAKRLPEPVVMHVAPCKAERVEVFLPSTAESGETVQAAITTRDAYDNPVPVEADVVLEHDGGRMTAPLVQGRALARLGAMTATPVRIHATVKDVGEARSNPCVGAEDLQLFVGDLHAHDFTCSAEGFTPEVYAWARDEKQLDFVSVAVQNHAHLDNEKWAVVKHLNEAFLDEGRFVTFLAFEWQHSHFGDKVIHYLGGDQPYLPVDDNRYDHPAKLYETLRGTDALIISHHPGYDLDLHVPGTDWDAVETDVDRLVELWSMHGSSEGYDSQDRPLVGQRREEGVMAGLRQGLRFGLVAGSDTHSARPGGSAKEPRPYWGGLAAVWAKDLTRRSLFEALRARRTYALTQARMVLKFMVNDAVMGEEAPAADIARIRIDAWAPGDIAKVEIMKNTRTLHTFTPEADECHLDHEDRLEGSAFYHCRVTQDDGELAVCSPVWIGS